MDEFRVGNWAKGRKKEELHDHTVELRGYGKFKGIENHPEKHFVSRNKTKDGGNGMVKILSGGQCKRKTNSKCIVLRRYPANRARSMVTMKNKKNWNKRRDKITRMKKLKVREIFCWDFEKNENSNYYQDPNSTYII